MAKANKITLQSNFKAARRAGDDAAEELIRKATEAMHDTAEQRLRKGAAKRGYNLPQDIEKTVDGMDGKIEYPHFYGRWFEYGTSRIPALTFMRPGHRAGRKVVKTDGEEVFEKWFKRKARVR